jgi:hypothetical protein
MRRRFVGVKFRPPDALDFISAALYFRELSMSPMAAPARIGADELARDSVVSDGVAAPKWTLTRLLNSMVSAIIRWNEEDIASRYQGSAWCDSVEHDLNSDIISGGRNRR